MFENEEGSKSAGCAYPAYIPRISFGIVCAPSLPEIEGAHPYRCGPRIVRNASNSIHFHGLGCAGADGPRIIGHISMIWDGPRFIGNALNFMYFHGLGCALGGVGGRRIIGNALNSIHFHALGCALGGRKWPQNHLKCIEFQTFPLFLVVLWGARVAPESLELH